MSGETEERVRDIGLWYAENRYRIPKENLGAKLEFLGKMCSCLMELVALQAKDIQVLEQRRPHHRLWMPTSVRLDDNETVQLGR